MFMHPPTIHQLTTLIRRSTRTSGCRFAPHTGSIAGRICILAGGGEHAVAPLSPVLLRACDVGLSPIAIGIAGIVLIARNYPQSEAVRSVLPANDVIRYALRTVVGVAAMSEESRKTFLALGQHFARQRQLNLFATQILNSLRGDSLPQLSYRIDTLLDLLARVPETCAALARRIPGAGEIADENALSEKICANTSKRQGRLLTRRMSRGVAVCSC
jgi:hypothetical protein